MSITCRMADVREQPRVRRAVRSELHGSLRYLLRRGLPDVRGLRSHPQRRTVGLPEYGNRRLLGPSEELLRRSDRLRLGRSRALPRGGGAPASPRNPFRRQRRTCRFHLIKPYVYVRVIEKHLNLYVNTNLGTFVKTA